MKISAGVAIVWKDKVLVVHPKSGSWYNSYAPPKGGIEVGEESIEAAVRETKEEIGIKVKKSDLLDPFTVNYKNGNGEIYKKVILYPLVIKKLSQIGLKSEKVPLEQLQLSEVDDARFMSLTEMKGRILPRYQEHMEELLKKYS